MGGQDTCPVRARPNETEILATCCAEARLDNLPPTATVRRGGDPAIRKAGIDPKRPFKFADANVRYKIAKRSFDCPAQLGS